MRIPEERLTAYIDGELDQAARAEVEAALREDPELAARAERHRKLRSQLASAYAPELEEPVPERLRAVLRSASGQAPSAAGSARVVDLAARRAAAAREAAPARRSSARWRVTSMAAGVLVALGAGFFLWHGPQSILVRSADGSLIASGMLARSLSDQLSGDASAESKVSIGLSFVAKSGDYCRAFSIAHGAGAAGLACRRNDHWQIAVLTQAGGSEQGGAETEYRTAGSSLPPAVLSLVQAEISGDPLDRAAEIAARGHDWRTSR